jgi:hypothetical protein
MFGSNAQGDVSLHRVSFLEFVQAGGIPSAGGQGSARPGRAPAGRGQKALMGR